jgi:hypothetical protein
VNKQTNSNLVWHEKVVGYLALALFVVGTLRAIQLEAVRSSEFVYLLGIVVVIFGVEAVNKLIKR